MWLVYQSHVCVQGRSNVASRIALLAKERNASCSLFGVAVMLFHCLCNQRYEIRRPRGNADPTQCTVCRRVWLTTTWRTSWCSVMIHPVIVVVCGRSCVACSLRGLPSCGWHVITVSTMNDVSLCKDEDSVGFVCIVEGNCWFPLFHLLSDRIYVESMSNPSSRCLNSLPWVTALTVKTLYCTESAFDQIKFRSYFFFQFIHAIEGSYACDGNWNTECHSAIRTV